MEQILTLMAFLGAFIFLAMGLCIANSIEAKESRKAENIILVIMILGIASSLIGFFGLFIYWIFS